MLTSKERRATIEAYEASFLARMEADVADLRSRLAFAERRFARAQKQKLAGEVMTAAMMPSVIQVLGLPDPFQRDGD